MVPRAGSILEVLLAVDGTGVISSGDIWPSRLRDKASFLWNQCKHSAQFPYLVSESSRPNVVEVIMFSCDWRLADESVVQQLRPVGLRLFELCCGVLDSNIIEFCRGDLQKLLKEQISHKSHHSAKQAHFMVHMKSAQAMWHGRLKPGVATASWAAGDVESIVQDVLGGLAAVNRQTFVSQADNDLSAWDEEFTVTKNLKHNGITEGHGYASFATKAVATGLRYG